MGLSVVVTDGVATQLAAAGIRALVCLEVGHWADVYSKTKW